MRILAFICALLLPLAAQARVQAVASFSIIGDMAARIGGAEVNVHTLVGPENDAHEYQASPRDLKAIGAARLVIVNGLGFEGWIARAMEASGTHADIVELGKAITPLPLEDDPSIPDPHAWQSLMNAVTYAGAIRDALIRVDPEHADTYRKNANAYMQELKALDTWTRREIQKIPEAQRKVITSHDAFQYFGRTYGITCIAPLSVSESEPSARELAALIDQIRQERITTLFLENISDPRLIQQLQRDTHATIGGTLYSDALAASGPASTYLGMFRANVEQLVRAMQGNSH